jgi:hypothetical protein
VPFASGTVTTVMDRGPMIEIDEPPSCAAGRVKTGAPSSGTAGLGALSASGVCPEAGGAPGTPGSGIVGLGSGTSGPGTIGLGAGTIGLGVGAGEDVGGLHRVRIGIQSAAGCAAGTGAAPIPHRATQRTATIASRSAR